MVKDYTAMAKKVWNALLLFTCTYCDVLLKKNSPPINNIVKLSDSICI